jgi:hypothetical protein
LDLVHAALQSQAFTFCTVLVALLVTRFVCFAGLAAALAAATSPQLNLHLCIEQTNVLFFKINRPTTSIVAFISPYASPLIHQPTSLDCFYGGQSWSRQAIHAAR